MVFWLRCFKTLHSFGCLTMMLCLSVRQTEEVYGLEPNTAWMLSDLCPFSVVSCLAMNLPVNDPILVQEHEGWGHLGSVKPGTSFIEFARTLDLEHQVSAIHIFHDEEQAVLKRRNRVNRLIIWLDRCLLFNMNNFSLQVLQNITAPGNQGLNLMSTYK